MFRSRSTRTAVRIYRPISKPLTDRGNVFRVRSRLLAGVFWRCSVGAMGFVRVQSETDRRFGERRLRQV